MTEGPWGGATAPMKYYPWTLRATCSIQSSSITLARQNFYDPIPYFNVRQCGVCIRDGVEVEVQLQVRMFFRLGLVKI